MSSLPFKKFIITFLFFNKNAAFIIEKLKGFGYYVTERDIVDILNELRAVLPTHLIELIDSRGVFDTSNETHVEWLKHFGVLEFYDFILRRDSEKNPPKYFNWCQDCLWIHSYKDIMCLVNILLFNNEKPEEISDIISFKYKKKVGLECLDLYKETFWNTENLTAKEALEYCLPFANSTLIVRKMRSGETELMLHDESNDGSDVPVTFHNTNYIKWKIGYKKIEVPTARDFLTQIKTDSYFKYYETMNMTRSVESEEESGDNEKLGAFNRTLTVKKNVEEQRVKIAKNWLDIYLKANEAFPENGADTKGFFEKMQQLELDFGDVEVEKISRIEDMPEVLADIKSDMSP
jgi:hypothetical protein